MAALEAVAAALQGAQVDIEKRRIVWPDGKKLTIDGTAARIQRRSGSDLKAITSHVIGWLEMHFEPTGLDEEQMDLFEANIQEWIEDYQAESFE
jgi:23S rRNA G2069 N7-methylase RlmK/C1962 C5-methylase RlmI